MAKWTCICGQHMNDHKGPDENCYLVFSDVIWDGIVTDREWKVNYFELPAPTFDVYVCPNCGRLMVFGDSNRCVFYRKELIT